MPNDCNAVTTALEELASTPVRVTMIQKEWDAQGQCKISVSLFRQNVGAASYTPADFVPTTTVDKCRQIGFETLNGQTVQHFYTRTSRSEADRGISEFWISSVTG